jgi:glycosyltransferase involved in cell wall biosynthesis
MTAPRLSIVTVCRNDRDGLTRTLDSVARQTWRDLEVLVVDGASTDGSAEHARGRTDLALSVVSEADRGPYDAMNKGIRQARGAHLLFLNAGDHLASDDALERVYAHEPREELVPCDLAFSHRGTRRILATPDHVDIPFLMASTLPHPATLIRRDLFERLGLYDLEFPIAADYDFFLRAILGHGVVPRHVPVILSVHYHGGLSTRSESVARVHAERERAQARNVAPLVRELHAEWMRQREARPGARLRALSRRIARTVRSVFRRLRGRPA